MKARPGRTALWIGATAFLLYAATGGGRIAGSDEVTMFEVARALAHGTVAVPEGATLQGKDGRFYSKNSAGEAVLAIVAPARRVLAARFVASFFNAIVAAVLLAALYSALRAFGVGSGAAFGATLLLGFTTPLWVYAKSFMAEPLEALGLLLALTGSVRAVQGESRGTWLAAAGVLLAVSAKLVMLPLALVCVTPLLGRRSDGARPAGAFRVLLAFAVALGGHLLYNAARFGTLTETGYGAQATPAAFRPPWMPEFWTGLYGLLLSSGKGIVWFAPAILLAVPGLARMSHVAGGERSPHALAARAARLAILAVWAVALPLYAGFEHWAGDGSFGPRYLLPLLPLGFVAVAYALDGAPAPRRRLARVLGVLGCLVQIGGVFIYFGAQMREAGDYPYTRSLSDPRFMSDSHFNPRFSPILGHWGILHRNLGEHVHGEAPRLAGQGTADTRLGIDPEDQKALLHGFDVWWMYARYAGVPSLPLNLALAVLLALALWTGRRAWTARRAEGPGR